MANINNLNTPNIPKLEQRVRAVESGAPMNNAAVGRSGFEVYDNGTINVSSGNIIGAGTFSWQGSFSQAGNTTFSGSTTLAGPTGVTGSLTVQGATSVTGPFTVTGVTQLNGKTDVGGAFTVTGLTKLQGNTTVSGTFDVTGAMATKGTLSVEGVTTLKSDLNVTTGKVKVGTMTLDPASASGAINFANGAQVASASNVLALYAPGGVDVSAPFKANNTVTMNNLPLVTSTSGMLKVFVKSDGTLCKAA